MKMSRPRDTARGHRILQRVRALPAPGNVQTLLEQIRQRHNVVGCFVGFKRSKGKPTRRRSLVCLVTRKVRVGRLRAKDVLPPALEWPDVNGVLHEIPTDVLESNGRLTPQSPYAGPGDDVMAAGPEFASVGIALLHPTLGPVVTTAGHALATSPGVIEFPVGHAPVVRISAFRGGTATCDAAVLKVHLSERADYALLRPLTDVPCGNLFRDQVVVSRPYIPGPSDLGRELVVLTASRVAHTVFRGVHANLVNHSAGIAMSNLLLTDAQTASGDSGACLADVHNGDLRVWGLLVGTAVIDGRSFSVFTTALAPIVLEGAEYLT